MLKFCPYAWRRCIKMGISSLNICIKIKFDFPFCATISMTSYKYSKYK